MKKLAPKFPVKSRAVWHFLIKTRDQCPECGGELDTGWECNRCGFDAKNEVDLVK